MNAYIRRVFALGLLCLPLSAMAEDVDLFVGAPLSATERPNVLIILDNTANWSAPFDNEIAALQSVIDGLPVDTYNIGLMMFTETGSGNSNTDGAYVRAAIRPVTAANKVLLKNLVTSFNKTSDRSNSGKIGKAMQEAYLYFSGGTPYAGNNKAKTDYTGNTSGSVQSNALYALPGNALSSKTSTRYISPVASGGCAKNFIIYISNGAAQDSNNDTTTSKSALAALGGNTTLIPLSPSGSQDNVADEWARFMKNSSLGIVTYAVDINKVTTGQGPGWTALLKSASLGVGGGKYFDVTSSGTQILDALNLIFTEIQSVNSVFASVSLPVSVNTQGTFLNQVYIGMFRPDENSRPRWAGNLKQYKLGYNNGVLGLQDADSKSAINGNTGFIAECARSFWTSTTADSYWSFNPQGNCLTTGYSPSSDSPDGNVVEKGAQAYKLRSSDSRTAYTCAPSMTGCTSLTTFASSNTAITDTLLGVTSASRTSLINWGIGTDVDDENINANWSEVRPSAHGDVVHSRPIAINYGTDVSPQVVVFYGANDGMLRAINGNRSAAIGSVAAGAELWSFMAPEFYPVVKRLRSNSPKIFYPGSTTSGATRKNYGLDGSLEAYISGSSKWLYASMRRGGKAIYAFDVTSASSPALKWKKGCDSTGCSSGFSDIGETWSAPKVFVSEGYGSGTSPLLAMGGGYDTCEDSDPHACTSPKGNKIYIMDANTGTLVKTFTTDRSVAADVTVIKDNNFASYIYAADLGGNVYRISGAANAPIGTVAPASWVMTKIASLGCNTVSSCASNRKFMFAPDVVRNGTTFSILIGSGDREKPLSSFTNAASVANFFFMIQDQPTTATWLSGESAVCGANLICKNSLLTISSSSGDPAQADLDAKKGWALQLASSEQVVTSSVTVFGVVTYSTHTPAVSSSGQCSNLGTAKVYNVSYKNAGADAESRYSNVVGGGLSPSPVAGVVILDDGTRSTFIVGGSPESSIAAKEAGPLSTSVPPKSRVFWNVVK